MNKNQQKMVAYGRLIDSVMGRVEEIQDWLSPEFEELRQAIHDDKLAAVADDRYAKIRKDFADGSAEYGELLKKFEGASAPARFIGNHKMLTKAFASFVAGCNAMTTSLGDNKQIDVAAFDAAEKQQDAETEKITKYLTKIQVLA